MSAEVYAQKKEQLLETGERVIFESVDTLEIDESIDDKSVEMHEAWHALAALLLGVGVKGVTVIPGTGYEGATFLDGYNPLVFAAAHAMHCDGTGHDLSVIHMAEGQTGEAVGQARALLSGEKNKRRAKAIATLLKRRKSIGGGEAWAVFHEINKKDRDGELYFVRVIRPDGTEVTEEKRAKTGEKTDITSLLTLIRVERKEEQPTTTDTGDIIVSGKLPVAVNDN